MIPELDPAPWVPVTSVLALSAWTWVLWRVRAQVRHSELLPESVREGALVAVFAACIGGTVASLGFTGWISADASAVLAIAWRAAVLACGVYALIGSAMADRAD